MVRIHFECDRALRLEFIFFAERLVRLLEKLRHIRPQDGTLFLVQLDFEVRGLVSVAIGKAVQKRERVVGRNVERITRGLILDSGCSFLSLPCCCESLSCAAVSTCPSTEFGLVVNACSSSVPARSGSVMARFLAIPRCASGKLESIFSASS